MNAPIIYLPGFITDPAVWFSRLWEELSWERRPDAPRREYWANSFDRSYTYGRGMGTRTYESQKTHELIDLGRTLIEGSQGVLLEGCFLNGYEGKRDHLGWHADDDIGIDHTKPIAIITLGQARAIEFRQVLSPASKGVKGTYGPTERLVLESGSLCLMGAGMQQTHEHRIPKADFEAKPRVSMTYRGLLP